MSFLAFFEEVSVDPLFQDDGLPLAIMGMLVVFAALTVLIIIVSLLPRVIAWAEGQNERRSTPDLADLRAAVGRGVDATNSAQLAYAPGPAVGNDEQGNGEQTAPAPQPQSASKSTAEDHGITPELVAVLTAAAEMELGPVRIVRTRPLTASELAWTLEGRIRHHASHRLQTRNR